MSSATTTESVLQHVKGLFLESPGLRLTPWQFQRLWNLEADQAQAVIDSLVHARFLRATREGAFVRRES